MVGRGVVEVQVSVSGFFIQGGIYFPTVINFHSCVQKINLCWARFMSELDGWVDSIEVSNKFF